MAAQEDRALVEGRTSLTDDELAVLRRSGWTVTRLATLEGSGDDALGAVIWKLQQRDEEVTVDKSRLAELVKLCAICTQARHQTDAKRGSQDLLDAHVAHQRDLRRRTFHEIQRAEAESKIVQVGTAKRSRWPTRLSMKLHIASNDLGLRALAEKQERDRWVKGIRDIVKAAKLPVAQRSSDDALLIRVAKGRRANTLRKHVKTWMKASRWLDAVFGEQWPASPECFAEFLEAMVEWRPSADEAYEQNVKVNVLRSQKVLATFVKENMANSDPFDETSAVQLVEQRMRGMGFKQEECDEQMMCLMTFMPGHDTARPCLRPKWTTTGPVVLVGDEEDIVEVKTENGDLDEQSDDPQEVETDQSKVLPLEKDGPKVLCIHCIDLHKKSSKAAAKPELPFARGLANVPGRQYFEVVGAGFVRLYDPKLQPLSSLRGIQAPLVLVKANACGNRWLISGSSGDLHLLRLEGTRSPELIVQCLGISAPASGIGTWKYGEYAFIGSRVTDSEAEAPATTSTTGQPRPTLADAFEVTDRWTNLGPITDFCTKEQLLTEDTDGLTNQIITCSGAGEKSGSLRFIEMGIPVEELGSSEGFGNVLGMWALGSHFLVLTRSNSTEVLRISECQSGDGDFSLEVWAKTAGLQLEEETLLCCGVCDRVVIQVTQSGVWAMNSENLAPVSEWTAGAPFLTASEMRGGQGVMLATQKGDVYAIDFQEGSQRLISAGEWQLRRHSHSKPDSERDWDMGVLP
eukprot:g6286.t1